jgi:hypothetical protein
MTRRNNFIVLIGIIFLGIGSRINHTGWVVFDKYLGDALYAAMVYVLLGLLKVQAIKTKFLLSALLMIVIECFQLTSIPLWLFAQDSLLLKGVAVLLGLQFDWRDLIAYAAGIVAIAIADTLSPYLSPRI